MGSPGPWGDTTENRIGVGLEEGSENGECVPWVLKSKPGAFLPERTHNTNQR